MVIEVLDQRLNKNLWAKNSRVLLLAHDVDSVRQHNHNNGRFYFSICILVMDAHSKLTEGGKAHSINKIKNSEG